MAYRQILVHLDDTERCEARIHYAAELGALEGAHLIGWAPTGWADMPASVGRAVAGPTYLQLSMDYLIEQARNAARRFDALLAPRTDVTHESRVHHGEAVESLIAAARTVDLVVVGQPAPEDRSTVQRELATQVVLRSGRPVLVVPHIGEFRWTNGPVVAAWDGGREAARAMADALPLLQRASRVHLVSVRPREDADARIALGAVQQWLERHRVQAHVHVEVSSVPAGEALLSRAADWGAQCLVMGGYGHPRWAEFVLGGATRTMLGQMTLPVLMSH
ncbi:universal stress protein [Caldimonas aquatica]|uniref:Universal stress protein n=1 Tax=Caldimonas aquatica TaxID=376175 RepID=A0ABY6MTP8_9BURK|nr:universal stress protein [Schlegelella aquatica]UZD55384.1 universal stress protein [Schlegelella aquatica]